MGVMEIGNTIMPYSIEKIDDGDQLGPAISELDTICSTVVYFIVVTAYVTSASDIIAICQVAKVLWL